MRSGLLPALVLMALAHCLGAPATPAPAEELPASFFEEETARFTRLAGSGIREYQIEAAQGFYYLRHCCAEPVLLPLLHHGDPAVRLQVAKALGVCGGRKSVKALIESLDDSDWEVRTNARDALLRMTAAGPFADRSQGIAWLEQSGWDEKEAELIGRLAGSDQDQALAALAALRFVGTSAAEDAVLHGGPLLGREGLKRTAKALERIGTEKALPGLIAVCPHLPAASWALAEIGGDGVEDALLAGMARWSTRQLDYMLNLDRIGSTRCWEHMPMLLRAFGLVIYRGRTDDLQFAPTAFQRVAGNLILRTGRSQEVVELILAECEGVRHDEQTPLLLRKTLADMKPELAPGFVRNDGTTLAQPLAALPHIVRDRRFVPRLITLLDHPALIVRIYATESLAALKAEEAAGRVLEIVCSPYPFPDPTSQASGKHFGRSKFVRWRGYVCIALGKLGGEEARRGLEQLAADPGSYRDVRYGSVVGLRFLGSPKSLPVLRKVAQEDIIREVRSEAAGALRDISLKMRLAAAPPAQDAPHPALPHRSKEDAP